MARRAGRSGVVACSALKRAHRETLRQRCGGVKFAVLEVPRAVLEERLRARPAHFMPASLLDSQPRTLEPIAAEEPARGFDGTRSVEGVVAAIVAWARSGQSERT